MSEERIEAALRQGPPDDPRYVSALEAGEPPTSAPVLVRVRPRVLDVTARRSSRFSQLAAGLATLLLGGILVAGIALRGQVGGQSPVSPAATGPAARAIPGQAFDAAVTHWSDRYASGVVVGVTQDGRLRVQSALIHAAPSVLRVGPVSRLTLVAAVLQLVAEGAVGLDETLEEHRIAWPDADRVTVRMLLSGSSGAAPFGEPIEALQAAIDAEPGRAWGPADAMVLAAGRPSRFEPGAAFDLVDTDDALLASLLERISGLPASAVIRTRVIEPLGLNGTYLFDEAIPSPGSASQAGGDRDGSFELVRAIASGLEPGAFVYADDIDPDVLAVLGPARGMASTGGQLARLTDALHGDSGLIPPDQRAAFNQAFEDGGFGGRWACPCDGSTPRALVLEGSVGLYSAYVAWFPADGTTIALVANRGVAADALAELVETVDRLIAG